MSWYPVHLWKIAISLGARKRDRVFRASDICRHRQQEEQCCNVLDSQRKILKWVAKLITMFFGRLYKVLIVGDVRSRANANCRVDRLNVDLRNVSMAV